MGAVPSCGVYRGIVCQHNSAQEDGLSFVFVINEFGDHVVHRKVHVLALSICLGVVSRGPKVGDPEPLVETLYYLSHEFTSTVYQDFDSAGADCVLVDWSLNATQESRRDKRLHSKSSFVQK